MGYRAARIYGFTSQPSRDRFVWDGQSHIWAEGVSLSTSPRDKRSMNKCWPFTVLHYSTSKAFEMDSAVEQIASTDSRRPLPNYIQFSIHYLFYPLLFLWSLLQHWLSFIYRTIQPIFAFHLLRLLREEESREMEPHWWDDSSGRRRKRSWICSSTSWGWSWNREWSEFDRWTSLSTSRQNRIVRFVVDLHGRIVVRNRWIETWLRIFDSFDLIRKIHLFAIRFLLILFLIAIDVDHIIERDAETSRNLWKSGFERDCRLGNLAFVELNEQLTMIDETD